MRVSVWVTWSVRRGVGMAPWPERRAAGGGAGGMRLDVIPAAAVGFAGAAGGVVESVGASFGCGLALDDDQHDGGVREAAVEVVSLSVLTLPGPWCGEVGTASAVIEVESEVPFGPNSFEFGRMLAGRLGPVEWRYAPGGSAVCDVLEIEIDGPVGGPGRMVIYPARIGLV